MRQVRAPFDFATASVKKKLPELVPRVSSTRSFMLCKAPLSILSIRFPLIVSPYLLHENVNKLNIYLISPSVVQ